MNDQVITTEELEAAHEEALQMNTQRDYFAEAAELGFSDVFAQAISTLGYGEYRPALAHLNQIRTFALMEHTERQQVSA